MQTFHKKTVTNKSGPTPLDLKNIEIIIFCEKLFGNVLLHQIKCHIYLRFFLEMSIQKVP